MFEGQDRKLNADHSTNLTSPQPAGVHHMLGVNCAFVRVHRPRAIGPMLQRFHHRVAIHLSPSITRAYGIGMRDARRVHVALIGIVKTPHEVLRIEQRMDLRRFFERDHFEIHAEVPTAGLGHLQPVQPLRRISQHDATGKVDRAVLAGLSLNRLIKLHRVLLQLGHVGVTVEGVHSAGGMPGGPVGQFFALQ